MLYIILVWCYLMRINIIRGRHKKNLYIVTLISKKLHEKNERKLSKVTIVFEIKICVFE